MADKKLVISLDDALAIVAGCIAIKGVEYPVKPISAPEMQMVERIESDSPPAFDDLLAMAKRMCPTLPGETWANGSADVLVGTIIGVAQTRVRKVEADLPLSSGPVTSQVSPAASPEG